MDKYLIINADDFGMCRSANIAVMDLLPKGCLTSSTIMAPCAWAFDACKFAKKNPDLAIGVHLTFTSEWGSYRWRPITAAESLCDDEGFMYHESDEFEDNAEIEDVEKEIMAQVNFLKNLGLNPSHLDNHMGSLYGIETGRFELLSTVLDAAGELGLPFRMPSKFTEEQMNNTMLDINIDVDIVKSMFGNIVSYADGLGVAMPDYLMPNEWTGPQNDSYENFKEYMYELYKAMPNGITETYVHPALESDELKSITGAWYRRVWEYKLMSDPMTKQHIEACGIKLINYRDLAEMRK